MTGLINTITRVGLKIIAFHYLISLALAVLLLTVFFILILFGISSLVAFLFTIMAGLFPFLIMLVLLEKK